VADFWMMVSMASPALFTSAHWTTRFAVSPNSNRTLLCFKVKPLI
jgi:hypothetical protein